MAKINRLPLQLPPGRWLVRWFGSLADMPSSASTLGIHAYFSLRGVPREQRQIEHRLVSLAHMPLLHLGAHIDGDSALITPAMPEGALVKRTLTLDLSPANTSRIERASLQSPQPVSDLVNTPEYNSQLIRVGETTEAPEVLIPSATLFLFFWGISSTFINAATSDHLHNPEMHLYNAERSDLGAVPARIEVRRHWTDDEALYLAALLKEPGAIDVGQQIFRAIAASRMAKPGAPMPFDVWPPFARSLSVTGLFWPIGSSWLLTHIHSADIAQDWHSLVVHREGGRRTRTSTEYGGPDEANDTPPDPPPPNGSGGVAPTDEVELSETPGGYGAGAADLPAVIALRARFPNLMDVEVSRPIDGDSVVQRKRTRRRIPNGPWTAITGRPLPRARAIKGKIVGDEGMDPSKDPSGQNAVATPFDDQLLKFRDLLARSLSKLVIADETQVQFDFWDPYSGVAGAEKPILFKLPTGVNGEFRTWLYRDKGCSRTKHGICIRIHAVDASGTSRTRYLVDLERRIPLARDGVSDGRPISTGLMVIWFDQALTVVEACINLQVVLADAARTRSTASNIRPMRGAHVATVRHRDGGLSSILGRAMAVEDQRMLHQASRAAKEDVPAE